MQRDRTWLVPLTGVVFALLIVVVFILLGEGQDPTDKSAQEIVQHYVDNKDEQFFGGLLAGLAGIFFLFFAGWLRTVLRTGEEQGVLSTVAFGGAIVFAAAAAIGGSLHITLSDLADDISPDAIAAINAIDWDYFIPFAVGMSTFLVATGLSAIRHSTLPRWLAWIALVIGIASYTPIGFFAFLAAVLWVFVASILLAMQARSVTAGPGG